MGKTPTKTRDPLAPIDFAVGLVSTFVVVILAVVIPLTIFGSGTVLGVGDPDACVVVDHGLLDLGRGNLAIPHYVADVNLHDDATIGRESVQVCAEDADPWQRAVAVAPNFAGIALVVGFLLLTRRAVKAARRHGLFTVVAARRTRTLGRFVLLGSLLTTVVTALSQGIVVDSVTDGVSWAEPLATAMIGLALPWALVLAAAGVLTFARILERAVPLQDDADATI